MSKSTPRRLRMNRTARLQSAKNWLPTFTGRDIVKGYRKWYGVSTVCAILELRQLGIKVDEKRLIQAKRTEETAAQERTRKRKQRAEELAATDAFLVESDENFAYIAGHTDSGFPYGVTWEEFEADDEPF